MRVFNRTAIYASLLAIVGAGTIASLTSGTPVHHTSPPPLEAVATAVLPSIWEQNHELLTQSKKVSSSTNSTRQSVLVDKLASRSETLNSLKIETHRPHATAVQSHKTYHHTSTKSSQWSDLSLLAHVIQAEAGGEPQQTKLAVGDVVMNRVHSNLYPHTVHSVIFQIVDGRYAFTTVQNGWIYKTPSQASWDAAREVLYKHVNLVPQSLVFYANSKTPSHSWVRTQPILRKLGDMYFAR